MHRTPTDHTPVSRRTAIGSATFAWSFEFGIAAATGIQTSLPFG